MVLLAVTHSHTLITKASKLLVSTVCYCCGTFFIFVVLTFLSTWLIGHLLVSRDSIDARHLTYCHSFLIDFSRTYLARSACAALTFLDQFYINHNFLSFKLLLEKAAVFEFD